MESWRSQEVEEVSEDYSARGMPTRLLLERGGPWEVMPQQHPHLTRAAERYIAAQAFPAEARKRVREVWLEGKYRRAWEPESSKAVGDG